MPVSNSNDGGENNEKSDCKSLTLVSCGSPCSHGPTADMVHESNGNKDNEQSRDGGGLEAL